MPLVSSTPKNFRGLLYSLAAFAAVFLITVGIFASNGWVSGNLRVGHENSTSPAAPSCPSPPATAKFDFDGDGKADISRARIVTDPVGARNEIRVRKSSDTNSTEFSLGNGTGKLAPGDFNGDHKTDAAIFNAGTWTFLTGPNPGPTPSATPQTISLGTTGDIPIAADYDGDGITDAAIYRPSTNTWWVKESSTSSVVGNGWGQAGDILVPGDYDGDAKTDRAVWRPSNGIWYLNLSGGGTYTTTWGVAATDVAVPADFDGDGKTDIAVFRRTTGVWYVKTSTSGFANSTTQSWGNYGDQPVPADYDGDGTDDFAIWRPKTGWWWVVYSGCGNPTIQTFELGVQGEQAVPSAYLQQVTGSVPVDELAAARLKPRNATGGTNLYSQNFSWGRDLVSLPGRSGLDLSLGIGYNSLVWTKADSEIYLDLDMANVSPGFRLGFPTVERVYFDDDKDKFAYMMVTASGSRIQFRQTSAGNVYETGDSSYAVLVTPQGLDPTDPEEITTFTVTTTDGTQMTYDWKDGVFQCTKIKDRNGNYITITYNPYGQLETITDTLARVVTVNYTDGYPTSITQPWKDTNGSGSNVTHQWATFTYMNMDGGGGRPSFDTNFSGLTPIGPPDGSPLKVLQKITYADGSSTAFNYNAYAQVYKVTNIAADLSSHELNSTEINISSPSSPTDCPRFTSTSTTVENFNLNGSGVPQAVIVTNTAPASDGYSLPNSLTGSADKVVVAAAGHPDELYSQIYFGNSGWKEGLTLATEDCTGSSSNDCSTRKRWTWTNFLQDDTGLAYMLNPRPVETRVGDGTNTKKTSIDYLLYPSTTVAKYGLVSSVKVYDADLATVLKEVDTTYDLSSTYTDRRVIGLPQMVQSYGRESTGLKLMSKITYGFDDDDFNEAGMGQNVSPTRHDGDNYGTAFSAGRGNLTSVTRWDAQSPTSSANAVTNTILYNTAGSVVARVSPWDQASTRTVKIGYGDDFTAGPGVATYAYPTTITDPAGNSSTVRYRYDIGANVEATSPAPQGQTYGKTSKRVFDVYGRLEKESVLVNSTEKSYTRYAYPGNNGVQVQTFSTLVDVDGDGDIAEDEAMTETFFDGAGRPLRTRSPHPGSDGGWSAVKTEYDMLGRVYRQSVPAEVDSGWALDGDDSAWHWNSREYDWMNRPTRIIPSDSDGTDYKDTLISYSVCGCAGFVETTVLGPKVPDGDEDPGTTSRRKQKSYQDILGRTFKTESFDWADDVYLRTEHTFNGRDQVIETVQTDLGPTPTPTATPTPTPSTVQTTTATFDGHGRLASTHRPEQRDGSTLKYTTYSYNQDDSIQTVTDARGAVTNYEYNVLGLPIEIGWTVPGGSGITVPGTVTFDYDNVGNRKWMDRYNVSKSTYAYDSLSRITSETVEFDDLEDRYTIEYAYHIGGSVKSVTDPFSAVVTYDGDKAGRTTAVNGSGFASVSNYASGIKYRAFGGLKQMTYGSSDSSVVSYTYDAALRPLTYQATSSVLSGFVRKAAYEYNADGSPKFVDDQKDGRFDQAFAYDHLGRLTGTTSGLVTNSENEEVPVYTQMIAYNAFGNMTSRWSSVWGGEPNEFAASYANNRKTNGNEVFDFDGNILDKTTDTDQYSRWKFDASGVPHEYKKAYKVNNGVLLKVINKLENDADGEGQVVKRASERATQVSSNTPTVTDDTSYFVRSTVLGQILTELNAAGEKVGTKVYLNGAEIAEQRTDPSDEVVWKHVDPIKGSQTTVSNSGYPYLGDNSDFNAEKEPHGASLPAEDPYANLGDPENEMMPTRFKSSGFVYETEQGCAWDYVPFPCDKLGFAMASSSGPVTINVNTRTSEGYGLYNSLESQVSIRRYDIRQVVNDEDPRLTREMYGNAALWDYPLGGGNYGMLVASVYVQNVSPFLGTLISRQDVPLKTEGGVSDRITLLRRITTEQDSIILDTINLVRKVLTNNSSCAKFFGDGAEEVLDILASKLNPGTVPGASAGLGIRMTLAAVPSFTTQGLRKFLEPLSATVHSNGMFFNDTASVANMQSNTRGGRAIQVLHELAHLLFNRNNPDAHLFLMQNDSGRANSNWSRWNTALIGLACKSSIEDQLLREAIEYRGLPSTW